MLYGDSCSGIPDQPHEAAFAAVNAVVRRLAPPPEFVLFLGDEIAGLTPDAAELRAQWHHWLTREMAWLDRQAIPLWHCTGNHTTYDHTSEAMFRTVLDMPHNGPPGQEGLSYWVRRGDLLLVFVHTLWTGLGGEGHVETDWLRFSVQLLIHTGMGPGGIFCRFGQETHWSSLAAASAWGAERLCWPARWSIGHDRNGAAGFLGQNLVVAMTSPLADVASSAGPSPLPPK